MGLEQSKETFECCMIKPGHCDQNTIATAGVNLGVDLEIPGECSSVDGDDDLLRSFSDGMSPSGASETQEDSASGAFSSCLGLHSHPRSSGQKIELLPGAISKML